MVYNLLLTDIKWKLRNVIVKRVRKRCNQFAIMPEQAKVVHNPHLLIKNGNNEKQAIKFIK